MEISYKLDNFEGPLDLLLHLIEKNKVSIYDIPIVLITEQYLEYVNQMDHEDIPYLLAMNFSGYDDGMSYNFWQYKTFSEEEARKHYEQSEEIAPMQEPSEWQARVDENIGLLTDMVKKHPGTEFYFSRLCSDNSWGFP